MSEPFVFISRSRIKEGKLEECRTYLRELVEFVEENEPRVIAFAAYVNEDGTEVSGVQVHPDAASMELHMQLAGEKIMKSFEFLETDGVEIYGTPSDGVLEMMKQIAGVPVSIRPDPVGGFARHDAADAV
jgi:hypothetical protein